MIVAQFRILFQGAVYTHLRRTLHLNYVVEWTSKLLKGKSKEATFDALYRNGIVSIERQWTVHDDIVQPFGGPRRTYSTIYTFDIENDAFMFSDDFQNLQLSLGCFREEDHSKCLDMLEPFELPSPLELDYSAFPPPYWAPPTQPSPRILAIVSRMISDFAQRWAHILRQRYRDPTFRKLARAILCIATLDFKTVERSTRMALGQSGAFVSDFSLPSWEPYADHIFSIGDTIVVLNQDLNGAMDLIRSHVATDRKQDILTEETPPKRIGRTYLALSVRHVMLCYVDRHGNLSYSRLEPLLDGIAPPSTAAITLLLQGLVPAPSDQHPTPTRLHNVPVEIQDRILTDISDGPVEAARLGCLLGLGSPFSWRRLGGKVRDGKEIECRTSPHVRCDGLPVDSWIWFGGAFSGMMYT